ncbi:MAG: AIR synthase related protein [Promethearchaeota archaeon]
MNTEEFVTRIQDQENFRKKLQLYPILKEVLKNNAIDKRVYKSIGEDSAAIHFGNDFLLISTDMINPKFIDKNPFSAGYSAIIVGIHDIYASGGSPLAATIEIQARSNDVVLEIIRGAKKAANQFHIQITRGHTSIFKGDPALAATILGKMKKDDYVSAGGAQPEDKIVIIWSPDGRVSPNGPFWDAITFKDEKQLTEMFSSLNILASNHLIHACKDISNSGLIGTIFMMLNYSKKGGVISIDKLMKSFNAKSLDDLSWWVLAYITGGFVGAVSSSNVENARKICNENGLKFNVIGTIDETTKLKIDTGEKILELHDWKKTPVFP